MIARNTNRLREAGAGGSNPPTPTTASLEKPRVRAALATWCRVVLSLHKPYKASSCPIKPGNIRAVVLVLFMVGAAQASEPVPATVISVYDGDTITVEADRWDEPAKIRLLGVDTPEIDGRCDWEVAAALDARDFVADLALGKAVTLANVDEDGDRYGRVLARVFVAGEDLTALLIEAGHGRPYDGGKRGSWCR